MKIAREQNKRLDVHVDQENNPFENETEMLARKTIEHGLEGRVAAIHAISVSAKPAIEQDRIVRLLRDAGVSVICCPSAALSMKQLDMQGPLHNSIAPVPKLLDAGVPVYLGVDNVYDLFMPLVDGDLWFEARLLMEACRFYDIDRVAKLVADKSGIWITGEIMVGLGCRRRGSAHAPSFASAPRTNSISSWRASAISSAAKFLEASLRMASRSLCNCRCRSSCRPSCRPSCALLVVLPVALLLGLRGRRGFGEYRPLSTWPGSPRGSDWRVCTRSPFRPIVSDRATALRRQFLPWPARSVCVRIAALGFPIAQSNARSPLPTARRRAPAIRRGSAAGARPRPIVRDKGSMHPAQEPRGEQHHTPELLPRIVLFEVRVRFHQQVGVHAG